MKFRTAISKATARFGICQPSIAHCTLLGIILSIGSLFWLTDSNSQDDPEEFRSAISLPGQTSSVRAIFSALHRTLIAVQLTTYSMMVAATTMMVATMAFERRCLLLRDATAISMYRYLATTPCTMLHPFFRGTRTGKTIFGIMLIVQLSFYPVCHNLYPQFSCTDMDLGYITGRREQVSLAYRFSFHVGTLNIRSPSPARPFLGVLPFRLHITDKRTFGTALSALF